MKEDTAMKRTGLPKNKTKTDPLGWIKAFVLPKSNPSGSQPAPAGGAPTGGRFNFQIRREQIMPAAWKLGGTLSLIFNVVLLIVVLVMARELFALKKVVGQKLLGGLYENFILMDLANITADVPVNDQITVDFPLHIQQNTVVTLTEDTRISNAYVSVLSQRVDIILPKDTLLPVLLDLTVPVKATIPIALTVKVNIPLQKTELHAPFIGLQKVVSPYYQMLQPQIKTYEDAPICKSLRFLCAWFFYP
jgi:hypothetical protein